MEPTVTDEDGDDVTVTFTGWMEENEYKTHRLVQRVKGQLRELD